MFVCIVTRQDLSQLILSYKSQTLNSGLKDVIHFFSGICTKENRKKRETISFWAKICSEIMLFAFWLSEFDFRNLILELYPEATSKLP